MDVFILLASISCVVVALIYTIWQLLNWVWFTPKKLEKLLRQQGFKGNSYKLFFGDFKEIGSIMKEAESKPVSFSNDIALRANPIYHNATQNYGMPLPPSLASDKFYFAPSVLGSGSATNGENSFVWFGPKPALSITDPEMIREIMSKMDVFPKPSDDPLKLLSKGIASFEAEKWAKHRKLISPAFHVDKLKHMVPSFYLSCGDMLRKWDEIMGNEGSCEVDVWPHLQTMTSDVISRTAFGSSHEEGRKIFELQREQMTLIVEAAGSLFIPGWRFLPTKFNRRMKEIVKEIESMMLKIIDKKRKAMETGETSYTDDLLGLLLESNSKEMKRHGNESGMSIKEVIEECKIFYFAGQETNSSLLVWTMILLSKHQDWQIRARDEVMQVFGRGKPGYQDLNHLKTMSMILHEALRLYPSGVTFTRSTHTEASLGKLRLPAGVQLALQVLAVHHDTQLWGDDASMFNPERFGERVSKATQGKLMFLPFGSGPRICLGQNFAMLEAKMAMVMILQRYSFQLSSAYTHAPYSLFTLQPQHGAHLILTKL